MIEEQSLLLYQQKRYYPVSIGDLFNDRYRVITKLGYGAYSTVWLARDESHQAPAPLEQLPPEVRRLLLSMLAFEELRALVHASPFFHQQYLADLDAWAVVRSGSASFSETRGREDIIELLKSYQDRRAASSSRDSILMEEILTEDDAVAMAAFFSSTIEPLRKTYVTWALANLSRETKDKHIGGAQDFDDPEDPCRRLSITEETRLTRAQRQRIPFRAADIRRVFFYLFAPWEVEEMLCFYVFVKETYEDIFEALPPRSICVRTWDKTSGSGSGEDEQLISIMKAHMPLISGDSFADSFINTFVDSFTSQHEEEVVRRCGYVMWDAARLKRTGGKELQMRDDLIY
ncbi:hypothetical protein DV735_g4461, partial [Chaetothyriales sp. CBS 134920]